MRLLDVGCRLGVIIQPHIAKSSVPPETDQLMNNDQNPDREMVDSIVHGPIIGKRLQLRQDEIRMRAT